MYLNYKRKILSIIEYSKKNKNYNSGQNVYYSR